MKKKDISLKQQLYIYERDGHFPDSDGETTICHGFYDWFCKDSSLQRKSQKLASKVWSFVMKGPNVNLDECYVFFKNNCPCNGPLYDDFRICDRKTGDVIYTVIPKCGHSGEAEIWGHNATGEFCKLKSAPTYRQLFS